jgi:hypothetical protein
MYRPEYRQMDRQAHGCRREWGEPRRQKSLQVRHDKTANRAVEIGGYYDSHPDITRKEPA